MMHYCKLKSLHIHTVVVSNVADWPTQVRVCKTTHAEIDINISTTDIQIFYLDKSVNSRM